MLQGERVSLRALREDDFDPWYALMNADVEVALMGAGTWTPYTVEAARERWLNMLHSSPDVRINFAIDADGTFIGTVALKEIDRRSQHAWLSIVLDASKLGQGYGRDALRALLRWAFTIQHFHRISLETWAINERALRCYRAAGFVEEGRMREAQWVDGRYVDVIQMGAISREWLATDGRSA